MSETSYVHVVLLSVISEDQILEGHLNLDPLLVIEGRPDVMGLCDCSLVRLEQDLCSVVVHVQCSKYQNEPEIKQNNKIDGV